MDDFKKVKLIKDKSAFSLPKFGKIWKIADGEKIPLKVYKIVERFMVKTGGKNGS